MAVPVSISDPVIIALFSLVGTALGLIGNWILSRHKREANLLERANAQVILVLEERGKQVKEQGSHIDDLKDEIVKLREHVRDLTKVMQNMLKVSTQCPRQVDGDCPVAQADLAKDVNDVINKRH